MIEGASSNASDHSIRTEPTAAGFAPFITPMCTPFGPGKYNFRPYCATPLLARTGVSPQDPHGICGPAQSHAHMCRSSHRASTSVPTTDATASAHSPTASRTVCQPFDGSSAGARMSFSVSVPTLHFTRTRAVYHVGMPSFAGVGGCWCLPHVAIRRRRQRDPLLAHLNSSFDCPLRSVCPEIPLRSLLSPANHGATQGSTHIAARCCQGEAQLTDPAPRSCWPHPARRERSCRAWPSPPRRPRLRPFATRRHPRVSL